VGHVLTLAEELGERGIIEIILKHLDHMPDVPISFGDDVSAIALGDGKLGVLKTDMLVGKTDIPPGMNDWQAARKAVVMNISDLAAKGVKPTAVLASVGIPKDFTKRQIEQIGKGLNAGAREYDAYVLGGDTNEAADLVISCTAFGVVEEQYLIKRSGAQPDNLVAVTGFFGKTSCGLKIMLDNLSASPGLRRALIKAVLMPQARLKEGLAIAKTRAATASVDSSDGLAWSLHEISKASNVGFIIDNLPVAPEAREFADIHDLDSTKLSLYGGEEYELVVTLKPELWQDAIEVVKSVGGVLVKIGRVTKEKRLILKTKRKTIPIQPKGWEHFRQSELGT